MACSELLSPLTSLKQTERSCTARQVSSGGSQVVSPYQSCTASASHVFCVSASADTYRSSAERIEHQSLAHQANKDLHAWFKCAHADHLIHALFCRCQSPMVHQHCLHLSGHQTSSCRAEAQLHCTLHPSENATVLQFPAGLEPILGWRCVVPMIRQSQENWLSRVGQGSSTCKDPQTPCVQNMYVVCANETEK